MNRIELSRTSKKNTDMSLSGLLGIFVLMSTCLLDPSASEISLETGLPTQAVKHQRYSLGGAGNVANNIFAMGVKHISVFGVIGDDPYGDEMKRIFNNLNIDTSGLLSSATTLGYPCLCETLSTGIRNKTGLILGTLTSSLRKHAVRCSNILKQRFPNLISLS